MFGDVSIAFQHSLTANQRQIIPTPSHTHTHSTPNIHTNTHKHTPPTSLTSLSMSGSASALWPTSSDKEWHQIHSSLFPSACLGTQDVYYDMMHTSCALHCMCHVTYTTCTASTHVSRDVHTTHALLVHTSV